MWPYAPSPCSVASSLWVHTLFLLCVYPGQLACGAWQHGTSLAQELANHLGTDAAQLLQPDSAAPAWDSVLHISRQLQGTGFHKTLVLDIAARSDENAAGDAGPVPQQLRPGCSLALLQPLPSSIFSDPYQLEDLTRGGGSSSAGGSETHPATASPYSYTFELLGPLDLELPAPACQATALLLHLNVSAQPHSQRLPTRLQVTLHAKYPQPQPALAARHGSSLTSLLVTGHTAAVLPWPWLISDCRSQQGAISIMPPPAALLAAEQQHQPQPQLRACKGPGTSAAGHGSSERKAAGGGAEVQGAGACSGNKDRLPLDDAAAAASVLLWDVPAGALSHQQLVSWGTLLVAGACCAAVSWTAVHMRVTKQD